MKLYLIRHGMTQGNLEKRYIGKTDEKMCKLGIDYIKIKKNLGVLNINKNDFIVISSPLKRCIETANLIYPEKKIIVEDNLREIDFGNFEGKSYEQLKDNIDYCNWLESGCENKIPEGESKKEFISRCTYAFESIIKRYYGKDVAIVCHGGTIMSILDKFERSHLSFYDYHCENGCGYLCEYYLDIEDNIVIKIIETL